MEPDLPTVVPRAIRDNALESGPAGAPFLCVTFGGKWPGIFRAIWLVRRRKHLSARRRRVSRISAADLIPGDGIRRTSDQLEGFERSAYITASARAR